MIAALIVGTIIGAIEAHQRKKWWRSYCKKTENLSATACILSLFIPENKK